MTEYDSERKRFETWAIKEGLIGESHGVRFVNSMCDVARKAWGAALTSSDAQADGGKSEAVGWALKEKGFDHLVFDHETGEKPSALDMEWAMERGHQYIPLYTTPQAKCAPREALTDEEIREIGRRIHWADMFGFARAIERASKEKA